MTNSPEKTGIQEDKSTPAAVTGREQDAIYQKGQIVARVIEPEIDLEAKEIRFSEVYRSDFLLLPEQCEFQKYKILVQRIADAMRVDRSDPQKGRVLTGVSADILGYNEQ